MTFRRSPRDDCASRAGHARPRGAKSLSTGSCFCFRVARRRVGQAWISSTELASSIAASRTWRTCCGNGGCGLGPALPGVQASHAAGRAATMLINSRVAGQAATAVYRHGGSLDLASCPDKPLEDTTAEERQRLAGLIGTMTSWPWVGASLATKTLHKKRPNLIPVLDNQAIFGAYMNPAWPEQRSLGETIKATARINEALDWIHHDLTRPENSESWAALAQQEPERTRIEIFDCAWWMHFRRLEPVAAPPGS